MAFNYNSLSKKKDFKDVVIFSGGYTTKESGQRIPGLDLRRFVNNCLEAAGIAVYSKCNDDCVEEPTLSVIKDLQAEIEALKVRLVALGG